MSWAAVGAIILGALLLKAILDPDTKIYRCPNCNLVLVKNKPRCPRCGTSIGWA